MNSKLDSILRYEINRRIDAGSLRSEFNERGRVRVQNFLQVDGAVALYNAMRRVRWRTLVVSKEKLMGTVPFQDVEPETDRMALELAHEGVGLGFASVYDADSPFSEDGICDEADSNCGNSVLEGFQEFLSSLDFIGFVNRVTGVEDLERVTCQSTRFRSGHFVLFNSATALSDKTRKRRICFHLGLTADWKPEWGGLLEFRNQHDKSIEAFVPCFNTLDLFLVPQGYWISSVAAFAPAMRLAVSGRIYAK